MLLQGRWPHGLDCTRKSLLRGFSPKPPPPLESFPKFPCCSHGTFLFPLLTPSSTSPPRVRSAQSPSSFSQQAMLSGGSPWKTCPFESPRSEKFFPPCPCARSLLPSFPTGFSCPRTSRKQRGKSPATSLNCEEKRNVAVGPPSTARLCFTEVRFHGGGSGRLRFIK